MNSEMQTPSSSKPVSRLTGSLIGGVILILVGLFTLVQPRVNFDLGLYFLPLLGIIFLVWAFIVRSSGLLIPGGILLGIGSGVLLMEGPFQYLPETQNDAVILYAFACGWVLISLLSIAIEGSVRKLMWWPLIPAFFLALAGASMLHGGIFNQTLDLLGLAWPVVLIAAGLALIFRRKNAQ